MDFEKAKSYLNKQDKSGISLYNHISDIIKKVLEEQPNNVIDSFENLSLSVKDSKLKNELNEIQQIFTNENEKNEIKNEIEQRLIMIGKKIIKDEISEDNKKDDENDDTNEEKENEIIDVKKMPNILENEKLLEWSGIKLKYDDLYLLQNSFIKLIKKYPNIQNSRFWGKINGINNDYWIIEAKLTEYPELSDDKKEMKCEAPGFGTNEYVYFVNTIIEDGNWIQLPYVTPNEIKLSKNIYKYLTGNLDSKITGFGYFEGNESNYLRCLIARISSSTIIAPNNYYKIPEEPDENNPFIIETNEEFIVPENSISYDSWVHTRGHLRLEGRIQKYIEPEKEDDDDENKDEKEPTIEEKEEQIPILTSIATDKCNEYDIINIDENEITNVWYVRNINPNIGYNIIVLNNKIWNGAKTIYVNNSKKFINVYFGNGLKYRNTYYSPQFPNKLEQEFNEFEEIEEQNPENEEETIKKQVSIYSVEKEIPPPPPEKKEDENNENNENEEANEDK